MKRSSKKPSANTRSVEADLKAFLESEDSLPPDTVERDERPAINLESALKLFDDLREGRGGILEPVHESRWTHASVVRLREADPVGWVISRARQLILKSVERGWHGPPYNPLTLAEMEGIKLLPTEQVLDAATKSDSAEKFTIMFNPHRPVARMRFSIAHELGHYLFPDCAAETRNRATHTQMKDDDWQLESLCNMAAAEILMPFGTFQEELCAKPTIRHVLELRRKYLVSCEAVVNRLLRLSPYPCAGFIARLNPETSRYFVEYRLRSVGFKARISIGRGYVLPRSSKVSKCIAIGAEEREEARWITPRGRWLVEYLGISPNAGEIFPRVLGLASPQTDSALTVDEPVKVVQGDALDPKGTEPKLLLQVVNDQARIWGGGFAKQARRRWPVAQSDFRQWAGDRRNLKLGNIHWVGLREDLTLVSLVSQHGFGKPTSGPRLRYGALFSALEKVSELATERNATVHMPRIGTGEAGGNWRIIQGIIEEALVSNGVKVTIYDLVERRDVGPRQPSIDFPKEVDDEVL